MSGAANPAAKPAYRVPSMAEIAAVPANGFSVATTFAGAGGSSLGYRMAGFRVLWANEFVAAAHATYEANKSPATIVDSRDIRSIEPAEILAAINLAVGELDILDGSPPCASFSMAGKRSRDWGKIKAYSDRAQRTDDLFGEFVRLVAGLMPKVFVAENVSGLVKGVAKGYFLRTLAAFKAAGYKVEARLLDAQWLGVPQARQRLIFQGVRADLGVAPAFPKPLGYRYSVRDALPWIAQLEEGKGYNSRPFYSADRPSQTILAERSFKAISTAKGRHSIDMPAPTVLTHGREHTNSELMVESETDISRFAIGAEWDKLRPGEKSARYF